MNKKHPPLKPLGYQVDLREKIGEIENLCFNGLLNYLEVTKLLEIVIEKRNVKEILKKIKK